MDWDPALDCEIQESAAAKDSCNYDANDSSSAVSNGAVSPSNGDGLKDLLKVLTTEAGHDASAVQKALADGADPNRQEKLTGQTALLCLVRGQQNTLARSLLHAKARVNTCDFKGVTPLMVAASSGNRALTMLLLEHAADVAARTTQGIDALRFAAQHGHMPIVRLLLQSGAPLENSDRVSTNPPLKVSQYNHKEVVKLLKSHRAQVNVSQSEPTRRVRVKNIPLVSVARMQQQYPTPNPKVTQEMPVFHRPPEWNLHKAVESPSTSSNPSTASNPVGTSNPSSTIGTDSMGGSRTESSEAEPAIVRDTNLQSLATGPEVEAGVFRENRQRWVDMADSQDVANCGLIHGIAGLMRDDGAYEANQDAVGWNTSGYSDPARGNQKKQSRRQRNRNAGNCGYTGNYSAG
jgi:hypothetical protein